MAMTINFILTGLLFVKEPYASMSTINKLLTRVNPKPLLTNEKNYCFTQLEIFFFCFGIFTTNYQIITRIVLVAEVYLISSGARALIKKTDLEIIFGDQGLDRRD